MVPVEGVHGRQKRVGTHAQGFPVEISFDTE